MQIEVFVSYKREERALTDKVLQALREAGYRAVTDLNITKNQEFGDAIEKMIRTARLTIVLWTEASAKSDWVRKEARFALALEKGGKPNIYLGVMVSNVDLDLPPDLRGLQMTDVSATGLTAAGLAAVLRDVQDILGKRVTTSPEIARQQSQTISEEFQIYQYTQAIDTVAGYEQYLLAYPQSAFFDDASRSLRRAKAWYLHPFRRGSMGHTIGICGIIVAALGVYVGGQAGLRRRPQPRLWRRSVPTFQTRRPKQTQHRPT